MSEEREFLPGFKTLNDYVQKGFVLLTTATRCSNVIPGEHTLYGYDNPTSGYRSATAALRHNATHVFKELLAKQKHFNADKIGKNFEQLPELNDILVDAINKDLSELDGVPREPEISSVVHKPKIVMPTNLGSWNTKPIVCPLQMGKTKMLAAKNVERPQVSFKDKVDNSSKTLWVPKITEKPNNLKPLALSLIYNDAGDPMGYVHPYEVELRAFKPQAQWLSKDGLDIPPLKEITETKLTMVETKDQLTHLVAHLRTVSEVGVDLEHHSYRTYQGITCLLQLTTEDGGDFIVDTLSLREHLHVLNECFTNPKILKIFHGGQMDIIWLQRDLGVYVVGMFDTYQASTVLELPHRSLKALLQRYCNVNLDKAYQLADWRIRPLPEEMCYYARSDTHYLIPLWRMMRQDLIRISSGINLVETVLSQSQDIALQTYTKPVCGDQDHMNMYLKSKKAFNNRQMKALRTLYQWRDDIARIEDESTNYVLPNHMLLQIAEVLPREVQGLLACCNPVPPLLKRHLISVHQLILNARETKMESNFVNNINTPIAHPVISTIPSVLMCVHDKVNEDDRDELPSFTQLSNVGPIRRQKKKYNRKPWSLETPPPSNKDVDILNMTKRFISPFERLLLVNEYKEYIQSHEEPENKEKESKKNN